MNISQLLRDAAASDPDKTALVAEPSGVSFTYSEMDQAVSRVAAGLADLGVRPGQRVALAMGNVPAFPLAYFGALRAGAVVVPLNVMLVPNELVAIMRDCEPSVVLAAPPYLDPARIAGAEAGVEVLSSAEWGPLAQPPDATTSQHEASAAMIADSHEDDLAVLAYTSGTTGVPKGAMLTHGNLLANLRQQMDIPRDTITRDDVLFLTLPLFHIFGLNVPLGLLVMNAATGVLVERFEPVETLRLIQEHRGTVLFGAPTMFVAWTNLPGAEQYDLSSVRLAVSGAAALSAEVLERFRSLFGITIYEGYGMTETSPTLTTNRMATTPKASSIGQPLPGVELRLVDPELNDVELGDPGEIVVRGPNVFAGYWGQDDATAAAFRDGWFRTGDVAVRDEEGYLYLVDRKRDLIIVSGFNVFPSEVEAALLADPKIADAAVIGQPHPYTGESVKAFVVLGEGASASEHELLSEVSSRLARFKCPSSIEIVPELPKLLTGKVLKRALRT